MAEPRAEHQDFFPVRIGELMDNYGRVNGFEGENKEYVIFKPGLISHAILRASLDRDESGKLIHVGWRTGKRFTNAKTPPLSAEGKRDDEYSTLESLKLLVADVQDYEAWQRPCWALKVAKLTIAREESTCKP